jgi:carboxypeptidase Taq
MSSASPSGSGNSALTFTTGDSRIAELLDRMHEIADLGALGALAGWDQNTALPDGAGEIRGMQLATLQGILHDKETDARLGTVLDELAAPVQQASFTDADRGLVREAKRSYDHATKLPRTLVEELARVEAGSFEAWKRARANNDFATFAPWLTKTVALQREVADRFGYRETRYDALLDLYEPGMTAARIDALFGPIRDESTALLRRIQSGGAEVDDGPLHGDFPGDKQVALSETVLRAVGYDFTHGGIAQSPHPFTSSFGTPFDVRVTVRTDQRFLSTSLMAAIHEGGHALYEQGSATTLARTPVAGGASLGAHESQSRLWENAIGRSDAFWQGQFRLVRDAFPDQFSGVDAVAFARALNRVQPSLIRVEADEVTYNLHIIVRFELEKAIVNGDVAVESLPGMWNAKYQEYLGVTPPTDSDGVLQDIHWSGGFGYFPTYTLGNLYSAQIYSALRRAFSDFDARLASGDTAFILGWLREHMYVYASVYQTEELMRRVTGETPNPTYFARYLNEKFERIYNLPPRR